MNLFQATIDPDADTSPMDKPSTPGRSRNRRPARLRHHFLLVAVAVPMVAVMVGIAVGALAAILL